MLEQMHATLTILDGQLQTLWLFYLNCKPDDWLHDRRKAPARLSEVRNVRQAVEIIQGHIHDISRVLKSHDLLPLTVKEN